MATQSNPKKTKLEELAERDPDIKRMLSEPVGTPIKLTREQAIAVVDAGIGTAPAHPTGVEYVRWLKKNIWSSQGRRGRRSV
jgi:hypothetical protein